MAGGTVGEGYDDGVQVGVGVVAQAGGIHVLQSADTIPAKWALEDDYGVVWEISQILAGYGGVEGI